MDYLANSGEIADVALSSAWETKGSVYNAQHKFSASNVVKKSAHYTRVNTVTV